MNSNTILDPETAIGECLETAFGLKTYLYLINAVSKQGFNADAGFRKVYNGYYKVRQRKQEWYDKYYSLMEEQRVVRRPFKEILTELNDAFGSIEVSFSSKLIATVDPWKPIWDSYVLKSLKLDEEWRLFQWKSKAERINKAVEIYDSICSWYESFLTSDEGIRCIEQFDKIIPQYANCITDVKKIDYLLVSKR